MDAEKKEMKKLISSILISCPLSMTVNKLNRDYYEAIGERIPYAKFGYQSLDSCLRDMPDVLQVQGIGGNALVKVFVSSKVAHIDKLISSQRLPDKKRPHFGRRPRQYNQNSNRRNNYTPRTYGQSDTYAFSPNRTPSSSEIYVQNERLTSPRDVPLTNFKFEDVNLSEISNDPKEVANLQQNIKESPKLDIKIDCDNACEVGQNGIQFNSRQSSPELFESDTDEDLVNYKVPFVVQQNLKTLISNYSDGLFCARIPEIYKKMFRKELCFNEYGYRSLIQMCESLKTIFFCHQPDKTDFKVYDVSKPIPVDYTKSLKLSEYNDYQTSFHDSRVSEELELPEDFSNLSLNFNYKYPLDVLQLYENIPREFVPDSTKRGDDTEVCIGEVYDPSKFWVILRSSWSQLQELMDDMQIFYINRDQSLLIPKHIVQVGLYCVAKYANEYHRAIIVKTNIPRDKVKVFYVDYGTVSSVNANELCFLHRTFIHLPQQAIRARLASIYPVHEQVQWSLESSNRFLDLVRSKDLVAQMRDVNFEEQIIEIILADTSGEEDIFINDTLVNEGYALFTHQIQLKTTIDPTCIPCIEFIHLYPTFEELELAKVPSTVETIRLLNVGISLSNVYSHYFYKSDEIPQREAEKEVEIQSKPVSEASRSRARLAKVQEVIGDQNANSPPMYKSASEASSRKLKKDVNDVCSPETKVDKTKCIESPSPSLASVRTETESTNEDILMGCNTRVTVEKPPNIPLEPPKSLNPANTNDYKMATIVKPPPGFQKQTVPVPNFVNVPQQVNPILLQPYHIQNSMPQFPLLNPAQHNMLLASMIQNQQVQQQQHNNLSCFNNYLLTHGVPQINNPQIQIALTAYNDMTKQILEQLLKGNMNVYRYIDLLILQKGNAIQRTSFDILQRNYSIVSYDNARTLFESFFILLTNNQILELYNYIVSQLFKKESIPKLVVQTELNGKSICLIRYENNIYVLVDEIFEHINVKIPIEKVKKLIVMENPNFCVLDINLNENRVMKEELCRFRNVASASVIHLFSFQDLPKIVKIFDKNCSIFNNFDIFLSKICNINGDIWAKS